MPGVWRGSQGRRAPKAVAAPLDPGTRTGRERVPEQAAHVCQMYDAARGAAIVWAFTWLSAQEAIERAEDCQARCRFSPCPTAPRRRWRQTDLMSGTDAASLPAPGRAGLFSPRCAQSTSACRTCRARVSVSPQWPGVSCQARLTSAGDREAPVPSAPLASGQSP